MWRLAVLGLTFVGWTHALTHYDLYWQYELTTDQYNQYVANNTVGNCTAPVAPCDEDEWRRIDGTCNNLKFPSAGALHTPSYRVLPASYNNVNGDWQPRLAKSGNPLPLCRKVRTNLISEGRIPDAHLTQLVTHILEFYTTDIVRAFDTVNYVFWRPNCCKQEGAKDNLCAPNYIPKDDPVHRFSGISCLNMTKPLTYTTSGCVPNTEPPLRIIEATPIFDMSNLYGNRVDARRQYVGGLLAVDTVNGRIYPTLSMRLGIALNFAGMILFWRQHNHIATKLAEVNPCWNDDQLFYTAREINMAFGLQQYYYELMPLLMGKEIYEDKISSLDFGFRDLYDDSLLPQISIEYPSVLKWVHLMSEGSLKVYDSNGFYLKEYPLANITADVFYILEQGNMDGFIHGCFRQATSNALDIIADPDITQNGVGYVQVTNDVMTNDCAKNRYFGMQPYVEYLKFCFKANIRSFDDLREYIPIERIEQLKRTYEDVYDIDMMAGLWAEKIKEGTYVTPTFYCMMKEQMLRSVKSDRHWYERNNRPHAFTRKQLNQIRWSSAARMLCDVGDTVTSIQREPYKMISKHNPEVSCDTIIDVDYFAWQDKSCPNAPKRVSKPNIMTSIRTNPDAKTRSGNCYGGRRDHRNGNQNGAEKYREC